MFDIFYIGKKPNLVPFEKEASSIEHAQQQSRTRYCWIVILIVITPDGIFFGNLDRGKVTNDMLGQVNGKKTAKHTLFLNKVIKKLTIIMIQQ